ncbi:GDSL-type esterase/lipase family protein [Haloferula sargassicola]|uniref:SGNH hydrolase-type esterase domain-containing protein n=1 Tax=Haloferula sargassicola TaxID=490096 RepID=A0ABP9UI43_9BACT
MLRFLPLLAAPLLAAEPPAPLAGWVHDDQADPPEPGAVVFIGSSSIRRWESLTRDFGDYRIVQRGWGGSWLREMDEAAPFIVFPYKPSAVVMWAGTNDLSNGQSAEQVHADFLAFHQLLRQRLPETPFLFLGATRTLANSSTTEARETSNHLIRQELEKDPHGHFVELPAFFNGLSEERLRQIYVDPIHLNRDGYAEWLKIVRPALEAVLPPNRGEFDASRSPKAGTAMVFDFGPAGATPAAGELRWNHWQPAPPDHTLLAGQHVAGLVDTTGQPLALSITLTGDFRTSTEGDPRPDPDLLGALADPAATGDSFFSTADNRWEQASDDLAGSFVIEGLDPALPCTLRFFGSGGNDESVTEFRVFGAGAKLASVSTGRGSGGLAVVSGIRPDRFGRVFVDLTLAAGDRASINALELRVGRPGE